MTIKKPKNKEEATKFAKELKAKMKTKGWRIKVWENLGWCYCISSPWITIHESYYSEEYTAYLNSEGKYDSGDACSFWGGGPCTSDDPNYAVAERIEAAEKHTLELVRKLAKVKQSLGVE
jgi:hypothetical protein